MQVRAGLVRLRSAGVPDATIKQFSRGADGPDATAGETADAMDAYASLDGRARTYADETLESSPNAGVRLLDEEICNSPCDEYSRARADLESSGIPDDRVDFLNRRLLTAIDEGEISDRRAAQLLGDVRELAEEGRDVTDLFDDDTVSRAIVRKYDADDRLDADSLAVMDEQRGAVDDLVDEVDGLSEQDGAELLVTYGRYTNEFDPGVDPADRQVRSVSEVQADLERLANEDDIDGVARAIKHSTTNVGKGNEIPSLKGLDGEVRIANWLLDDGSIDVKEMELNVEASVGQQTKASEIDIDARTSDGTTIAIESKNRDYAEIPPVEEFRETEIGDLRKKLEVLSRNRDRVVIVSRTSSPRQTQTVQEAIERADFKSGFDPDTDLEFSSYEDLRLE